MIEYSTFQLANGLRVVHNYDPVTAMVALNVIYNVGARDESPQLTGMAHLFEHLMFAGSVNAPDFDGQLQQAGGMSNAFTTNDITSFYEYLPAQNAETAFWLESDRMLQLALSDRALEVQRSVVIEEFKQRTLNAPYGTEDHAVRSTTYTIHPYRFPVIGKEISHIEHVTLNDLNEFYFSHYAPNNAVLAVTGNITLERTRELAEKWFGSIPRREIAPRLYSQEPIQTAPRLYETTAANIPSTSITVAYHMGAYGSEDYYAGDVLTDILAYGQSSRMFRNLIMGSNIFSAADAMITGADEPGLLLFKARLRNEGANNERRALELIDQTIDEIFTQPVTDHEINSSINRTLTSQAFQSVHYLNKAFTLATSQLRGIDPNTEIDRYRALTSADITRVASTILRSDNRSTIFYRPT